MKTQICKRVEEAGSALLAALAIFVIFTICIGYYLSLVQQQSYLNSRSQTWNMAIAITEAGIEEGLENLNDNGTQLGATPWSFIGGNTYYRSNTLPDGNSYTVYITNTIPSPVVVARAYVQTSTLYASAQNVASAFFAAVGVGSTPTVVTRAVRVNCTKTSLFLAALVAKQTIDLNGNNVAIDSFSSCDPTKSVNGQYVPGFYSGDQGDIGSNQGLIDTVSGGNANIYGKAHTGTNTSGQTTISFGPNGAVGSHAWQASNKGLQPGWALEDANFTFPDTTFPSTSGFMTATGGVLVICSNVVGSWSTNYSVCPSPLPSGGVTTNTTPVTVSNPASVPLPVPAGTTTNSSSTATVSAWSSVPTPTPTGTATNTSLTTSLTYPTANTYVGVVTTNIVSTGPPSGRGTWYTYNFINSYTYPVITYTYPTYTYTWSLYGTNVVYSTNSYNNILWGTTDLSLTNKYAANSLSGQTVVVGNNVVLALPNGLSMSGNDTFTIMPGANVLGMPSTAPAGAGVLVYSGGNSIAIGGNGVMNQPGYAADFIVFCAPTVTSFSLSGNGGFTGVLVAPSVNLTLNGGGNNTIDFIGCAMVNSATLNGHFNIHYDECLANMKNNPRYLITAWNEVP
jgi:hypothetical protein